MVYVLANVAGLIAGAALYALFGAGVLKKVEALVNGVESRIRADIAGLKADIAKGVAKL